MTTIRKIFDKAWAASEQRSWVRGLIGAPDGTIQSPTRAGFCYLRVSQEGKQSVTLAKHLGRVPLRYNLPVKARFENGTFVIYSVDDFYYGEATATDQSNNFGIVQHTHMLGSGLEYEIEPMRVGVGLVKPAGGWVIEILSFRYLTGSTWETYPGATISLLANRPATSGKHRLAVVAVDPSTNTASVVNGSEEDYATTLDQASIDAISIGSKIPLAAVRIRADDTTINVQSRFIDARGWLNLGGAGALSDLSDTNISTPTNGQMLYYNSVGGWYNAAAPTIPDLLEDLSDVGFTTLSDGDYLIYDSGTNEWVNVGPPYLDDLANVVITAPAAGQTLVYDDGSGEWVNADPEDVVAGGALDDLSDVTITTPADRDVLVYDSGNWVNRHTGRTLITDWSFRDNTLLSTSSYAWKGNRFTPDKDVDLYAMCFYGTIVANATYQAAVITGTATPGNVNTVVKSASHTVGASPASTAGGFIWLEFSAPVRLTAGTQYGLMVGRTDSTGTYQLPVLLNGGAIASHAVPMPGASHGANWQVADASLSAGSTITQATGNSMGCGFRFRFPDSVY